MKIIQGKNILEIKKIPKNSIVFIPEVKTDKGLLRGYVQLAEFSNSEIVEKKHKENRNSKKK